MTDLLTSKNDFRKASQPDHTLLFEPHDSWPGKLRSMSPEIEHALRTQGSEPFERLEKLAREQVQSHLEQDYLSCWSKSERILMDFKCQALSQFPQVASITRLELDSKAYALWRLIEPLQDETVRDWQGMVGQLAYRLSSVSNAKDAAMAILEVAERLFTWDAAHLNLYPAEMDRTIAVVNIDTIDGKRTFCPLAPLDTPISRVSQKVLNQGGMLLNFGEHNMAGHEAAIFVPYGDTERNSKTLMFVPIRKGNQNIGVLSIQSYSPYAYTRQDLDTFQLLADYCGASLERIMAQEGMKYQSKLTSLFSSLGKELGSAQSPREAAETVVNVADELFGWDSCYINLYDREKDLVTQLLAIDLIDGKRQTTQIINEREVSPTFRKILESGAIIINRKQGETKYEPGSESRMYGDRGRRSASLMYAPMRMGKETVGIISFQSYTFDHYNNEDMRNLQALADHCAGALRRSLAEQNLRIIKENLEQSIADRTQELADSIELLRTTLNATTDSIVMVDHEGHLINCNDEWSAMWGVDDQLIAEQKQDAILDVMTPFLAKNDAFPSRVKNLRAMGMHESFDFLNLKDGRIVEAYSCLRELGGKKLGRVWSFRDVTLRSQAEEALHNREAIYRKAIETANGVPYTMIYGKSNYEFMGEGITELIGYSKSEITKSLLHEIKLESRVVDPDFAGNLDEYHHSFRIGDRAKYQEDIKIRTKDGEVRWLSDCSVAIKDETGIVTGSIGILQDITGRKRAEEQVLRRQQHLNHVEKLVALGTLVSGVAHEINNPNNFIKLNVPLIEDAWNDALKVIQQKVPDAEKLKLGGLDLSDCLDEFPELFKALYQGSERIENIVRELGDFARSSSDSNEQQVDLNSVVKSSVILLGNAIKNATSNFHQELCADLPSVTGNSQRLEQVAINLIQNACQSLTSKQANIWIRTRCSEDGMECILEVEDEGCGIPENLIGQIEDPFFTTKRDTGGTGLGLSISSNIINDYGGKISFDSEPDKGTRVTVVFPSSKSLS